MNKKKKEKLEKAINRMLDEDSAVARCRQCGHEVKMRIPKNIPFWNFVCPICNYVGQDWIRHWL